MSTYRYFLRNRTTGAVIDLGRTAEISEEDAKRYGIDGSDWESFWEFMCEKEKAA